HEVVDEQLAAAIEQFGQCARAVAGVEAVFLVDRDPWQFAALPREFVAQPGVLLLAGEQLVAGSCPLFPCSDLVTGHCLDSPFSWVAAAWPGQRADEVSHRRG